MFYVVSSSSLPRKFNKNVELSNGTLSTDSEVFVCDELEKTPSSDDSINSTETKIDGLDDLNNLKDAIITKARSLNLEHVLTSYKLPEIVFSDLNYKDSLLLAQHTYEMMMEGKLKQIEKTDTFHVVMTLFVGDFDKRFADPCVLQVKINHCPNSTLIESPVQPIASLEIVYKNTRPFDHKLFDQQRNKYLLIKDNKLKHSNITNNLTASRKEHLYLKCSQHFEEKITNVIKKDKGYFIDNFQCASSLQITVIDSDRYNFKTKKIQSDRLSKERIKRSTPSNCQKILATCEQLNKIYEKGIHKLIKDDSDIEKLLDLASKSTYDGLIYSKIIK